MKLLSHIYQDIKVLNENAEFLPTGLAKLDYTLDGGLMRKELIVLGGYTGCGKSFLSAQIFFNIAKAGYKSAYFSTEISTEMIVSRLIGQQANLKPTKVMMGLLNPDQQEAKMRGKANITPYENLMHFSDDIYRLEVIKTAIEKNKYDFVVIDFIQNILTNQKDEYSAMTLASLELQKMAKKYNCCILVVSQLSNSANREGRLEYKGSGGIAQVTDLGFFIERPKDSTDDLILKLRKNRRGVSGISFGFKFRYPGGQIE